MPKHACDIGNSFFSSSGRYSINNLYRSLRGGIRLKLVENCSNGKSLPCGNSKQYEKEMCVTLPN